MKVVYKNSFEDQYIRLREKEGRLYTDDVVKKLPHVSKNDPLFIEWQLRKQSSDRLLNYLASKKKTPQDP